MSSDLIAAILSATLGVIVIAVGLRRNLADVTQSWLPRFGEVPRQTAPTPVHYEGGQERQPLSPWQKRLLVGLYLMMSAVNADSAIREIDDRVQHVILAALFAVGAVVFALRDRR